jgi:predicted nucleic acid-binding protein
MKLKVYLDTSIVSFLCGRLNENDAHTRQLQTFTREWWRSDDRLRYELAVSRFVLDEAGQGDERLAATRLDVLSSQALVEGDVDEIANLAEALLRKKVLPAKATYDALHIACCACTGVNTLATWNFRHLANANNFLKMQEACTEAGYAPPHIVTLYQLSEL